MNTQEFSDTFDTLLNSHDIQAQFGEPSSERDIVLDEYEKSVYLTKAQEEIVVNLYNGKNPYGDSFEGTEEMRRYLEGLVKTKVYNIEDQVEGIGVTATSVFYPLPEDIAFITMEQVTYDDDTLGCYNGSEVTVYPVTQDEYGQIKGNPFRGPTKYKVIRLDSGNNIVELVSKFKIGTYLIRYLMRPKPIILEDLPNNLTIEGKSIKSGCTLNPILHKIIIKRAVLLALQAKGANITK